MLPWHARNRRDQTVLNKIVVVAAVAVLTNSVHTYIDCVVVNVLEYTGVVVDLSLEESWCSRRRTQSRVGWLQVETRRRAHCLWQLIPTISLLVFYAASSLSVTLKYAPTAILT